MDIHLGPTISFRIYKDDDLQHEIDPCQVRIKGEGVIYKKITCYLAFTGVRSITSSLWHTGIWITSTLGQGFELPRTIYRDTPYKLENLELADEVELCVSRFYVDEYY